MNHYKFPRMTISTDLSAFLGCSESETLQTQKLPALSQTVQVNKNEVNFLLASSLDKEMVDILTSLAEESSQPASQKTALSQSILLDQGRMICS